MASCSFFKVLIPAFVASCVIMPAAGSGLFTHLVAPIWHSFEERLDLEDDDARALDIKSEDFWQPVQKAAEAVETNKHAGLYKDAAKVLAELPANNSYVHDALQEAVAELQHADALTEQQASDTLMATEHITVPEKHLPPLTGADNVLSLMMMVARRWLGITYKERLHQQVEQRQAEIMPSLRGANRVTGDVLKDTRLASNRAFDVLKYDLYERSAPKTPEAAKAIAHRVIDAVRETRHSFFEPLVSSVDGLARDARGENEASSVTVDEALAGSETSIHDPTEV